MPRSPTVYTLPPGTTPQAPNTVIGSAMFNSAMDDIAQTFNTAQPIAYGGTGATTAAAALTALTANSRLQATGSTNLTDWNSLPEGGSGFYTIDASASNRPAGVPAEFYGVTCVSFLAAAAHYIAVGSSGDCVTFRKASNVFTAVRVVFSGTAADASLAPTGYQKLPSGLIMQWGRTSVSLDVNSNGSITYPVAFTSFYGPFTAIVGDFLTTTPDPYGVMAYNSLMTLSSATFAVRPALPSIPLAVYWTVVGV